MALNRDADNGMTDYHCHLLPGLDDGARNLEDSLQMAAQLAAAGFTKAHCTPHSIRGLYETTREQVLSAVTYLQEELDRSGIVLELLPGMEYYLDEFFPRAIENPVPLGESRLLLVEAPPNAQPSMVQENIFYAVRQGFTPLFAHPERMSFLAPDMGNKGFLGSLQHLFKRNDDSKAEPLRNPCLETLREQGCLFQGNISSFAGYYGRGIQQRAEFFQKAGLYAYFGSDGHRPEPMSQYLAKGMRAVFKSDKF